MGGCAAWDEAMEPREIPPQPARVTPRWDTPCATAEGTYRSISNDGMTQRCDSLPAMTATNELYGFQFHRYLQEESNFSPQDGHQAIEVLQSTSDFEMELSDNEISESAILPWLRQDTCREGTQKRLQLLHFKPRNDNRSFRPFPISPQTFREIFDVLDIPRVFLRVLLANLPIAMKFKPKPNGSNDGRVGIILRSDAFSFAQFGLCLVYNPVTQCSKGICIGLRSGEYKQFLGYLDGSLHCADTSMLLPLALVDFMSHMTARWLTYNRFSIMGIANSKEMNIRERQDDRGYQQDLKMDLDTATRKLTFLNDEYAITESISKTQLRFLELIEKIVLEEDDPGVTKEKSEEPIMKSLQLESISFLRQSFVSALQSIERDRHSIQGLVQTTYCLIAQKESRQNLIIATESGRIADESRKVAIWTRRDSTDMRIITVITMLFLPGTFVATLFSTSFFNFQPANPMQVVSKWSWLYLVVTFGLTTGVLLAWFFVSRSQNQKMAKKLNLETKTSNFTNSSPAEHIIAGFWTTRGESAIWDDREVVGDEARYQGHQARDSLAVRRENHAEVECGGGCGGCGG